MAATRGRLEALHHVEPGIFAEQRWRQCNSL
jgi:hypothetical protein